MNRSRLSRRIERQNKRALFASIAGIFVVLFFLLKYGLPLLANFSLFIAGSKTSQEQTKNNKEFIASPVLSALPTATNSALFKITGSSVSKHTIALYVNDEPRDKVTSEDDGSFAFNDVTLTKGENSIKTRVEDDTKKSDYSQISVVTYENDVPSLTIDSPTDGKSYAKDDKNANIAGKTDPGVKITVNGFWAIVDASGAFSYTLPLQNGENKIVIMAVDNAGNKSQFERKVTYSP